MRLLKLYSDAHDMNISNNLFTSILDKLETANWQEAQEICDEILSVSDSIEQRLATLLLKELADTEDPTIIKDYLDKAYSY